jgi:hypothetical protein
VGVHVLFKTKNGRVGVRVGYEWLEVFGARLRYYKENSAFLNNSGWVDGIRSFFFF